MDRIVRDIVVVVVVAAMEADLRYVVTSPPVMFRPTPSFLAVMCGAMIGRCP